MKITIAKFDPESRTVAATFTLGAIIHERTVNAVLKADGSYDRAATRERVEEVGRGVAHKIAVGVIGEPQPSA
jgi:hypothetical protein